MSTVLVLNSSALGGASVSKQLAEKAVAQLRAQDPHLRVVPAISARRRSRI
ncbi:hypothetical protein FRZ61_14090 [Hypericibacter adhaerens]|uniref:NADPH-dependent FMN reductase-like domain-containing protein n=1 Tax=Hypericibacter adhaerens TaxID=2602016 RepID=A0A5J6MWF3_9PROT|nr:hypothetical protein [Hypericibacter adhaerens]QEX21484.1 hypothetical protein FRZ61_14090 [Hypericibacter adhaerens]